MQNLLKILTTELQCLKDHLNQVCTQTKAFEEARTAADFEKIVTLQTDWSENPKLQQSQGKSLLINFIARFLFMLCISDQREKIGNSIFK